MSEGAAEWERSTEPWQQRLILISQLLLENAKPVGDVALRNVHLSPLHRGGMQESWQQMEEKNVIWVNCPSSRLDCSAGLFHLLPRGREETQGEAWEEPHCCLVQTGARGGLRVDGSQSCRARGGGQIRFHPLGMLSGGLPLSHTRQREQYFIMWYEPVGHALEDFTTIHTPNDGKLTLHWTEPHAPTDNISKLFTVCRSKSSEVRDHSGACFCWSGRNEENLSDALCYDFHEGQDMIKKGNCKKK